MSEWRDCTILQKQDIPGHERIPGTKFDEAGSRSSPSNVVRDTAGAVASNRCILPPQAVVGQL